MVGGSIVFTFSALTLVALWTPCKEDDICVLCLFPLVTFIMFCINIWGATVVFGKLKPLLNANQNFKKKAKSPFKNEFVLPSKCAICLRPVSWF